MKRNRPLPMLATPPALPAVVVKATPPADSRPPQPRVAVAAIPARDLLDNRDSVPAEIREGFARWIGDNARTKRKAREYLARFGLTGIHKGRKCEPA